MKRKGLNCLSSVTVCADETTMNGKCGLKSFRKVSRIKAASRSSLMTCWTHMTGSRNAGFGTVIWLGTVEPAILSEALRIAVTPSSFLSSLSTLLKRDQQAREGRPCGRLTRSFQLCYDDAHLGSVRCNLSSVFGTFSFISAVMFER